MTNIILILCLIVVVVISSYFRFSIRLNNLTENGGVLDPKLSNNHLLRKNSIFDFSVTYKNFFTYYWFHQAFLRQI